MQKSKKYQLINLKKNEFFFTRLASKLVFHFKYNRNFKMDITPLKKNQLVLILKSNNIKNYSKLTRGGMVDLINEKNISISTEEFASLEEGKESGSESSPKAKVKKDDGKDVAKKTRFENLSKKLKDVISTTPYEEKLGSFKEDVDDTKLLAMAKDEIAKFIEMDTLTEEDYRKYVDSYGLMKAFHEYFNDKAHKDMSYRKKSEEDLYAALAKFIFKNDKDVVIPLLKKFRKYITDLGKLKAKAAAVKKPAKEKPAKKSKDEEEDVPESDSDAASDADDDDK